MYANSIFQQDILWFQKAEFHSSIKLMITVYVMVVPVSVPSMKADAFLLGVLTG